MATMAPDRRSTPCSSPTGHRIITLNYRDRAELHASPLRALLSAASQQPDGFVGTERRAALWRRKFAMHYAEQTQPAGIEAGTLGLRPAAIRRSASARGFCQTLELLSLLGCHWPVVAQFGLYGWIITSSSPAHPRSCLESRLFAFRDKGCPRPSRRHHQRSGVGGTRDAGSGRGLRPRLCSCRYDAEGALIQSAQSAAYVRLNRADADVDTLA
jgi:hypothetical protein